MNLKCGIVGLPNVGKSTLFNVLSDAGADAANFPFCTIDPNVGVVPVPDERLDKLFEIVDSKQKIPATVEFVDIAGLVKGASEGRGKGNAFLAHIREVDLIVHVVRCFADPNVIHVEGDIDPSRDIRIIEDELILKDLDSLEKKIDRLKKEAKGGDKKIVTQLDLFRKLKDHVEKGNTVRSFNADRKARKLYSSLFLLTDKPVLYACNIGEEDLDNGSPFIEEVQQIAEPVGARVVTFCAKIEEELSELPDGERDIFLEELGIQSAGLDRLIKAAYKELGLITFFTFNDKEVRAWTVENGTKAPQAAGVIHSDFERGFIKAETAHYDKFVEYGSEQAIREKGEMRQEGKDYVVQDGDVILFRFNV